MSSGPFAFEPVPLTPELADNYRRTLRTHTANPETGRCPVCEVPWCEDARLAWVQLVCAGESYEPVVGLDDELPVGFAREAVDGTTDRDHAGELPPAPDEDTHTAPHAAGQRRATGQGSAA